MGLLLRNEFAACRALCQGAGKNDMKCQLVACQLLLIQAVSTHSETDLNTALTAIWALDKRASYLKTVEGKLLQADLHFFGAIVQIIGLSYIKAALNIRRSWNFYAAASKQLEHYDGDDFDELQGWADWGQCRLQWSGMCAFDLSKCRGSLCSFLLCSSSRQRLLQPRAVPSSAHGDEGGWLGRLLG